MIDDLAVAAFGAGLGVALSATFIFWGLVAVVNIVRRLVLDA